MRIYDDNNSVACVKLIYVKKCLNLKIPKINQICSYAYVMITIVLFVYS